MGISLESIYTQLDEQQAVLVDLLNAARKTPVAPDRLSDVCMKLSILNGLLGEHLSDLKTAQLEKEKRVYASAKESKVSDTGAGNLARLESLDERQAYDKAETRHKDLWKLISMAQTHIRSVSDERKGL